MSSRRCMPEARPRRVFRSTQSLHLTAPCSDYDHKAVNVICIEPGFPPNQREFVRGLAAVGASVIGIGERPADQLDGDLKSWMLHYERFGNVPDVHELNQRVGRLQH